MNSSLTQYALETNVGQYGTDPCEGDSGGPLLFRGRDLEWILVGTLIGGGFDCYRPEDRSDNTSDWSKVTIHVPWIQSIIRDLEPNGGYFVTIMCLLIQFLSIISHPIFTY